MKVICHFFVVSALAVPGSLMASSISYVTAVGSIFSGAASSQYDSVTGLKNNVGSCYQQGTVILGPCASIASDPAGNVTGLTAASVALINGVSYDPHNGISGFGSAAASANLAAGILKAATSGPNCSVPDAPGCDSGGFAVAEIQDNVTFRNTTGQTVGLDVYGSFDGNISIFGGFPRTDISVLFCFAAGGACNGNAGSLLHGPINSTQSFAYSYTFADGVVTNRVPSGFGIVSASETPGANATSENFHEVLSIPAGLSTASLNEYLDVYCLISGCDFSHTGRFSLGALPAGVSFTSESGVLLTQATPEPGTWVLLASGGVAMALYLMLWRRRAAGLAK